MPSLISIYLSGPCRGIQKHRGARKARSGALAAGVESKNTIQSTESEGFSTKIDRAIGKLRTEPQAIWLTRNIRRSLKGDKADQTHGAFGAKLQIRPLLTQTSQRLRDLRYDSAPGILWSRLGDAADGRANEGELTVFGRPRRPYLGRSCRTLVHGLLETEMDPMVILGPR